MQVKRYQQKGIEVYGLSADPPSALKKFSKKCGLTYALLSDENHTILSKLGAWGKKKSYGREYEGVIRSTVVLDKNNVVTHIFRNVSVKEHALEVAEALGL